MPRLGLIARITGTGHSRLFVLADGVNQIVGPLALVFGGRQRVKILDRYDGKDEDALARQPTPGPIGRAFGKIAVKRAIEMHDERVFAPNRADRVRLRNRLAHRLILETLRLVEPL